MRTRVSASAKDILWSRWDGKACEEGEDESEVPVDGAWKQRPPTELASAISLFVSTQERPEDLVLELACKELASVKAVTGDAAMHTCHGCPSLCTLTFPTWYRCAVGPAALSLSMEHDALHSWSTRKECWLRLARAVSVFDEAVRCRVLFKELVDRFAMLVQQAVASTNEAVGSVHTRLMTQDLQGQIDSACAAFAALAKLVKQHDSNQMVLQAALRSGGKFTELFLKVLPPGSELFLKHTSAAATINGPGADAILMPSKQVLVCS